MIYAIYKKEVEVRGDELKFMNFNDLFISLLYYQWLSRICCSKFFVYIVANGRVLSGFP